MKLKVALTAVSIVAIVDPLISYVVETDVSNKAICDVLL